MDILYTAQKKPVFPSGSGATSRTVEAQTALIENSKAKLGFNRREDQDTDSGEVA